MFKKKYEIDELADNNTDIFQHNMLERYIGRPNDHFKIDLLCSAEFVSFYYILPKMMQISENDCQRVVLNDEIM